MSAESPSPKPTARDALIAELLGDVLALHDAIKALPDALAKNLAPHAEPRGGSRHWVLTAVLAAACGALGGALGSGTVWLLLSGDTATQAAFGRATGAAWPQLNSECKRAIERAWIATEPPSR